MNWDAIGAIGELIGAAAVVLTLIYLARQLRLNTEAMRSAAWQATQDAEHHFDAILSSDRETMAVFVRGLREGRAGFEDDEVGLYQWWTIAKQLLDLFQTHHYQFEMGLVPEDWWHTWVLQYQESIDHNPGFREFVKQHYPNLRPTFQAFVDAHPYRPDADLADRATPTWPVLGGPRPE